MDHSGEMVDGQNNNTRSGKEMGIGRNGDGLPIYSNERNAKITDQRLSV